LGLRRPLRPPARASAPFSYPVVAAGHGHSRIWAHLRSADNKRPTPIGQPDPRCHRAILASVTWLHAQFSPTNAQQPVKITERTEKMGVYTMHKWGYRRQASSAGPHRLTRPLNTSKLHIFRLL